MFASLATVSGADHRDSPINIANAAADINDVYAFRSPANNNNLVVAFTVNPLIVPSDNATRGRFDPTSAFQVHVDRNGDLADDATVNIRITSNPDQLIIEGLGEPLAAPITMPGQAPVITSAGPVRVFAGLRDDPFFFDLSAFQAFVANPQAPARGLRPASAGAPVDNLAGLNVLAVVMEVPVTAVTGAANANTGTIKAWVSSTRNGMRIDRMAIPAINSVLIPSAQKDAFNAADPIGDAATYRSVVATTITTLRNAVDPLFGGPTTQDGGPLGGTTPQQLAAALIPDVVTIDFSKAVQFPNGRRLQDDVIDVDLGLVLNRGAANGISDGVSANDKAFGTSFPYLADPHTATTGSTAIRPPSTGDGGLLSDSGAMWTTSAALLVVAIVFGSASGLAALKARGRR